MAGFSFIALGKADMMVSDFFWNDVIYTVNGILDLGPKPLDPKSIDSGSSKSLVDITSVPTSGYMESRPQPQVGHVYAIKTRDGKYGIIQIAFIRPAYKSGPLYLYFFWRYQPNGSTSFP